MKKLTLYGRKTDERMGFESNDFFRTPAPGGAEKKLLATILEKIRNLIDTIMDYLPNLLKGFKDGFLGMDRDES